jgi:hypothetical protein
VAAPQSYEPADSLEGNFLAAYIAGASRDTAAVEAARSRASAASACPRRGAGIRVLSTKLVAPWSRLPMREVAAPQSYEPADSLEGNFLAAYIAGASRDRRGAGPARRAHVRGGGRGFGS